MNVKKAFQYGLLTFLFLASFLFYKNYFSEDLEVSKTIKIKDKGEEENFSANQNQLDNVFVFALVSSFLTFEKNITPIESFPLYSG